MIVIRLIDTAILAFMSFFYKPIKPIPMPPLSPDQEPNPVPEEDHQIDTIAPPRTADHADSPDELLTKMCLAIKSYEGWSGPGSTLNGIYYPNGTPSYRFNNPGNLNYAGQPYAVPALSGAHVFAKFDTPEHGFEALVRQVRIVANGTSKGFNAQAFKLYALANCSLLTLSRFFSIYAPASDKNSPDRYALWVASEMGVDPYTFRMRDLVG